MKASPQRPLTHMSLLAGLLRSACIAGAVTTALVSVAACTDASKPDDHAPAKPQSLHNQLLTVDTHIDIPLDYMRGVDPKFETDLQVDLPKLKAGRLDSGFWIIYTPQDELTVDGFVTALDIAQTRYRAIQNLVVTYSDTVELAHTAADVRDIVARGKHAVLIGMENAYPLGGNVNDVPLWARRGVRYVGITHFGHNQFGDSSNANMDRDTGPRHKGLSILGKELVLALNKAGVMIDVSHAAKSTMMQAADLSRTPIIASHSGAKAVGDNPRNLDDEQLRKIAEVGGVAQMVAFDGYVKPFTQAQLAFREGLRAEMNLLTWPQRRDASPQKGAEYERRLLGMWEIEPRATVADFVDHIDHAVKVAGIDHVGIASDFDGGGGVDGWQDASETANVTAELVRRGYTGPQIAKIWGENLLRVLEAAEAGAREAR